MKKYLNKSKILGLAIATVMLSVSCTDDDAFVEYAPGAAQVVPDSYVQVETPVVPFQAGTASYNVAFNVVNGIKSVTKIDVYSVYTDADSGMESERSLFGSYTVSDATIERVSIDITYADLRNGITVNGGALPTDDALLPVGSGWKFDFELTETASGESVPVAGSVNIAVLSPFAGLYTTVAGSTDYYRIGVQSTLADWGGETRFIGSVDEDTFSYNDFWGPFGWAGNAFNFDIDLTTNLVTAVPIITASGFFSGNRALDCAIEPLIFTNVSCAGSNMLVPDFATGKHRIHLTYGYFTDGSGAREFTEILEKVVN